MNEDDDIGTIISNKNSSINSKKQWIANSLKSKGEVIIDSGAANAVKKSGKSLLPVGIKSITGNFKKGDLVTICNSKNIEIARGLSNYDAVKLSKIIGKSTKIIKKEIDLFENEVVIHTDNMICLKFIKI